MTTFRVVVSVLAGYLVYALASMLLIGQVMESKGIYSVALGIVGLALIAGVAGLLIVYVSGEKKKIATATTAGLITIATLVNLSFGLGLEPVWYKLGTVIILPAGILFFGFTSYVFGDGQKNKD